VARGGLGPRPQTRTLTNWYGSGATAPDTADTAAPEPTEAVQQLAAASCSPVMEYEQGSVGAYGRSGDYFCRSNRAGDTCADDSC